MRHTPARLAHPSHPSHPLVTAVYRLPHAHILIILLNKILSPRHIDAAVSAEMPDPTADPELHALIVKHMLHPRCDDCETYGCRIDKDKKVCPCVRHFPKPACRETVIIPDGYPMYRRRGRFFATVKGGRIISDHWVVPYNAYLMRRYKTHCNVEICAHFRCLHTPLQHTTSRHA